MYWYSCVLRFQLLSTFHCFPLANCFSSVHVSVKTEFSTDFSLSSLVHHFVSNYWTKVCQKESWSHQWKISPWKINTYSRFFSINKPFSGIAKLFRSIGCTRDCWLSYRKLLLQPFWVYSGNIQNVLTNVTSTGFWRQMHFREFLYHLFPSLSVFVCSITLLFYCKVDNELSKSISLHSTFVLEDFLLLSIMLQVGHLLEFQKNEPIFSFPMVFFVVNFNSVWK